VIRELELASLAQLVVCVGYNINLRPTCSSICLKDSTLALENYDSVTINEKCECNRSET